MKYVHIAIAAIIALICLRVAFFIIGTLLSLLFALAAIALAFVMTIWLLDIVAPATASKVRSRLNLRHSE